MAPNQKLTPIVAGRRVASVRQGGTALAIEFDDGSIMEIQLQEATSSVMLRDKSGAMEYAD